MKFELYKTTHPVLKEQWRWRVTARNGKIVAASSEGFRFPSGAKRNFRTTLRYLIKLTEKV